MITEKQLRVAIEKIDLKIKWFDEQLSDVEKYMERMFFLRLSKIKVPTEQLLSFKKAVIEEQIPVQGSILEKYRQQLIEFQNELKLALKYYGS